MKENLNKDGRKNCNDTIWGAYHSGNIPDGSTHGGILDKHRSVCYTHNVGGKSDRQSARGKFGIYRLLQI